MNRKAREAFDDWCQEFGLKNGSPTPAIAASHRRYATTEAELAFDGNPIPALELTIEAFCLRVMEPFRFRGSSVRTEYFQRRGSRGVEDRELAHCRHCKTWHVLLTAFQAVSIGLLEDPKERLGSKRRLRGIGRANAEVLRRPAVEVTVAA